MDKDSPYYKQVSLLIRMLPVVATETVFALKGGTAINLFVRDFPQGRHPWVVHVSKNLSSQKRLA